MRPAQTLIVVLLVLAVVLTLGLSIASRSLTEVNVSTVEDESSKALDAAESGVEAALGSVASIGVPVQVGTTSSTYTVQTTTIGGGGSVSPAERMRAGDMVTIYMSTHDPASGNLVLMDPAAYNKNINICWGDSTVIDANTPAMEARLYYYEGPPAGGGVYGVSTIAYDPSPGRVIHNGFTNAPSNGTYPCGSDSRSYAFWVKNIDIKSLGNGQFAMPSTARPLFLRLRLFYNGDYGNYVGVEEAGSGGTFNFPFQGVSIVSSGVSGTTLRKLSVYQRYPDLPPIFDGPVYAGSGGLIKP